MGFRLQKYIKSCAQTFPLKSNIAAVSMATDVGTHIFTHFFKLFYQKNIVTKYENDVLSISENHQTLHVST